MEVFKVNHISDIENIPENTQKLEWNIDYPIDALAELKQLEVLEFGYEFNQNIDKLKALQQLKSIKFGKSFDRNIYILKKLKQVKVLEFGAKFNQDIDPLGDMEQLENLTLGHDFNQQIYPMSGFKQLKSLTLGVSFNQSIIALKDFVQLEHLELGSFFRGSFDVVRNLKQLKSLSLPSYSDNFDISVINELTKLEFLYLPERLPNIPFKYPNSSLVIDFNSRHLSSNKSFLRSLYKSYSEYICVSKDRNCDLYIKMGCKSLDIYDTDIWYMSGHKCLHVCLRDKNRISKEIDLKKITIEDVDNFFYPEEYIKPAK